MGTLTLLDVYEKERIKFLGYVRRRLQGYAYMDEEDVVADVFTSLFARSDLIEEVDNLIGYIYGALLHRIQSAWRQRARESSLAVDKTQLEGIPDPSTDVEDSARSDQARRHLAEALETISAPERSVWIATEIEKRSFRELAEETGESMGTLLSRKSRATTRIRNYLKTTHHYRKLK